MHHRYEELLDVRLLLTMKILGGNLITPPDDTYLTRNTSKYVVLSNYCILENLAECNGQIKKKTVKILATISSLKFQGKKVDSI